MADDTKTKDSRDRGKSGAPEGATPASEQRRFRGQQPQGDGVRRTVDKDEDPGSGAELDPQDEAFIDKAK